MRRLTVSTVASCLACVAARGVQSLAVVNNIPPATTANKLGVTATREDIAKAHKVPVSILDKAQNPRLIAFTEMDLARARYAPLIASVNDTKDYRHIEREVEQRFISDESKLKPVPGALAKFKETAWTDMAALMTFYEETMYPIRAKHREFTNYQLTSFHIKDVLKRGLSAFKQEYLDQQKEEMVKVQSQMKACNDFIAAAVKDAFTTDVCNDIANILRVAGEKYEHAHSMAGKVLDDMNMMKVPYNSVTREIVQALVFGDGPFDNSPLLFELIEYPERGEVSLAKGSLEDVSNEMLKLISNRHQTPLDDGALLRSTETHPNLQRSPE